MCRARPKALAGRTVLQRQETAMRTLLVRDREALRGEPTMCLGPAAGYCRRREAIRRTDGAPTRQDRTVNRRDGPASLRDMAAAIAVPATAAVDRLTAAVIQDAVLRHPAGERRHLAQAVAGTTEAAPPVRRAPMEVPVVAGAIAPTDKLFCPVETAAFGWRFFLAGATCILSLRSAAGNSFF